MIKEILIITGSAAIGAALKYPMMLLCAVLLKKRDMAIQQKRIERIGLPIIMAIAGGLLAWRAGLSWRLLYMLLLLVATTAIAVIDAHKRIIPNEMVIAIMALTAAFGLPGLISFKLTSSLLGFVCCFILFLTPVLLKKNVGAGDVKLAAAMGFCTGLTGSMYAVAIMGGLILLYTVAQDNIPLAAAVKQIIPMGPFIAVALLVVQAV
ncbi:MAG: A24 family peptidase [Clostridia bacterium]